MSRTLLLADENVTTHRIVTLTFAKHDVRVISVVDGIQAIEQIERERPDIILADANLPGLNGYEIAQYVTSRPPLAGVPVLILTGAFDTINESRVRQSGAEGVIVRPFEPAVVINKVKELLGFGDKLVPAPQGAPRRVPVPAVPQSRPPRPSGGGPQPVVPRTGPVAVAPARDAQPPPPAAVDQLRHESGPGADSTPVEGSSGAAEDYFDRLDAAFDTLDAQLAVPNRPASARRNPPASFGEAGSASARRNPPASFGEAGSASARRDTPANFGEADSASAQRDLRPSGDPTQTADTVAAAADPPVFEVDADWFAESPRDDDARPLSAASSQPRRVEPTGPAAVSSRAPAAPVASAFAREGSVASSGETSPKQPAFASREGGPPAPAAPAASAVPSAPPVPQVLAAPAAPPAPAALAAPPALSAPEYQAPLERDTAPEQHTTPSRLEHLTAASAPAAPERRTTPSAPDARRAPAAPGYRAAPSAPDASGGHFASVPHIADAFDALLAAEERRDQRLISARDQQMSEFSDDVIDRIAARVAQRLADGVLIDAVRKGVAAITERLVRDEIERNRTNAQRKT